MSTIATTPGPAATSTPHLTPISWPLRAWLGVEVMFGVAAIATIFLRPQDSATNFAWPIKPDVMAATNGAFYISVSTIFVLAVLARHWEQVRVIVIPAIVFTATMLLTTFLHWDKFSVGTLPYYVWFASYLLPPPIFAGLYIWQQKRAAPVGAAPSQPLPAGRRSFLRINGLLMTGVALLLYLAPALLQQIGPWDFTPLTARTLCGWLLATGLLQVSMAWEGDWPRVKLAVGMLIALPVALLFQLFRFAGEVQWSNLALWALLLDVGLVALLVLYLWIKPPLLSAD